MNHRYPRQHIPSHLAALLLLAATALAAVLPAAAQTSASLAPIQAMLDRGDSRKALDELARVLKKEKSNAEAYLLRSTAYAMEGDPAQAYEDLKTAVGIDPNLRQAWLNLAGLEIAERRYEPALQALQKAREIDPRATDNDLNIGAVLLFMQRTDEAREHFGRYLAARPNSAEAAYLVAANYAIAGLELQAVDHLRTAFQIDERMRLKARSDDRFVGFNSANYRDLLNTDFYQPPAGSHTDARAFKEPYRRAEPILVYAVLEALKENGMYYDPGVETSDRWAIIWGEMRVKVYNQPGGTGVVSVSAPAGSYSPGQWKAATRTFFDSVYEKLQSQPRNPLDALKLRKP